MSNPISIPEFIENKHFRELSPKEGKYKYRYITMEDIEVKFKYFLISSNKKLEYMDPSGKVWLTIYQHSMIISKNYAWNGCSPKRWIGVWLGTPDFDETIVASLIHDVGIQFYQDPTFPFTRPECDEMFKYILIKNNFKYSDLYYRGVKFGTNMLPVEKYTGKSRLTLQLRD